MTWRINNFINLYVEYFSNKIFTETKLKEILDSDNNSELAKISKALKKIKEKNVDVFENILAWDDENILLDYLKIIQRYQIRKKAFNLTTVEISRRSGVALATVNRMERLESNVKFSIMLRLLKATGLGIDVIY